MLVSLLALSGLVGAAISATTASAANAVAIEYNNNPVTVSPGLTTVPAPQSLTLSGDVVVTGLKSGVFACELGGNGLDDDYAEGLDLLSGWCGGVTLPFCVVIRIGVYGTLTCADAASVTLTAGHLIFKPNEVPPAVVTSFQVTGVAIYADAP